MPYSSASFGFKGSSSSKALPHMAGQRKFALQAQQQLEDSRVEEVAEAARLLAGPAAQGRRLVVEEDAAVPDRRLTAQAATRARVECVLVPHRHVRPPVPGRDADRLRDVVDSEDRPALVAPGHDQRPGDPGPGPGDRLDERRFPATPDLGDVELPRSNQAVDLAAPAQGADDHDLGGRWPLVLLQDRTEARDAPYVFLEIGRGTQDPGVVARVDQDRGRDTAGRQTHGAGRRCCIDEGAFPERGRRSGDRREEREADHPRPGHDAPCAYLLTSSTRRFSFRPASVSLGPIGANGPTPRAVSR